jgi:DNA modification methylase
MSDRKILIGNVIDELRTIESSSVRVCVTSPPYWGKRDYGTEPQIWAGELPICADHQWGEYFLAAGARSDQSPGERQGKGSIGRSNRQKSAFCGVCGAWKGELGLEPTPELYVKHIVEIFREVRRVLTDDGTLWINLGDTFIGGKGFSATKGKDHQDKRVRDKQSKSEGYQTIGGQKEVRPTDDRRMMKLSGLKQKDLVGIPWMVAFALRADGWYLRSEIIWDKIDPMPESVKDRPTVAHETIFLLSKSRRYHYDYRAITEPVSESSKQRYKRKFNQDSDRGYLVGPQHHLGEFLADSDKIKKNIETGRNKRSVWRVRKPSGRKKVKHFAVFPVKLVEPSILAGSERGDTVLDPFCGTGTALLVAMKYGRNALGIELNPKFAQSAIERTEHVEEYMI